MPSDDSNANEFVAYAYSPSLPLAATFVAIFTFSTLLHTFQLLRTRTFYLIPIVIGGIFELIGYIGRVVSSTETYPNFGLPPYILQAILILIAPALLAASIYMTLGYIILATGGERHALIREKYLTKIFVLGDIMSFLVQSTGAGLLTKKEKDAPKVGRWIIIGGLAIQIMFFGFFIYVASIFYLRMHKDEVVGTSRDTQVVREAEVPKPAPWRLHMWALFLGSSLIMIRSLFRVVEYVQGDKGYLLSHEIYLYIFDAALMVTTLIIFNVVHPSQISGSLTGNPGLKFGLLVEKRQNDTRVSVG